jgi:phosphate transport system substrate-binding protein
MQMKRIVLASLLALSCLLPAQAKAADEIVVNGSTTVLPVMQKAAESFMAANPDIKLVISGGGSGNGIKALGEKQCDVAMSSRDIKDKERAAAEKKGVKPVRIVPVVNPENPVKDLSLDQLAAIYSGKVRNWKELGGQDGPIVVISRDTSSGTFESWQELVMKKERVTPAALMQASNGTVVQAVAKNKNAIGYIGLGYLDKSVKSLTVSKVAASAKTALDGEWPIARELYIFTNGDPKGGVKKLVDYLLAADKGQKDVLAVGYVPLQH